MLLASTVPLLVIFYWLAGEVHYKTPERPRITYITTFEPERSDDEIIASNIANQEVQDLREAAEEDLAERKREIYKALGRGIGMDVDQIAAEADARRAQEEAEAAQRRAGFDARSGNESADTGDAASQTPTSASPR